MEPLSEPEELQEEDEPDKEEDNLPKPKVMSLMEHRQAATTEELFACLTREEKKQFAKAHTKCKTFKERRNLLLSLYESKQEQIQNNKKK